MFQSLLFWMIGSGMLANFEPGTEDDVSILVVLDDWFGLREGDAADRMLNTFQSLLFWMIGSGTTPSRPLVRLVRFQSLLFWMIGSG